MTKFLGLIAGIEVIWVMNKINKIKTIRKCNLQTYFSIFFSFDHSNMFATNMTPYGTIFSLHQSNETAKEGILKSIINWMILDQYDIVLSILTDFICSYLTIRGFLLFPNSQNSHEFLNFERNRYF
jgi:hypothetical protein